MQPLSYQSAESSCWTTCMVNGIRLVTRRNRVSTRVYRKLQCLLQDYGVPYDTPEQRAALQNAIQEVNNLSRLNIRYHTGAAVADELLQLQFDRQVAVCDIGSGAHSILLHKRGGDWFEGFDPWWYDEERSGGRRLRFPKGDRAVNVKIHQLHLFGKTVNHKKYNKGEEYHMGDIRLRSVTVIE